MVWGTRTGGLEEEEVDLSDIMALMKVLFFFFNRRSPD
jgi:hypothetical protein